MFRVQDDGGGGWGFSLPVFNNADPSRYFVTSCTLQIFRVHKPERAK